MMTDSCTICGRAKDHITKFSSQKEVSDLISTLENLDSLVKSCQYAKKRFESTFENNQHMGKLKSRYIELLREKERTLSRTSNLRSTISQYDAQCAELSAAKDKLMSEVARVGSERTESNIIIEGLRDVEMDHAQELYIRRMRLALCAFHEMRIEVLIPQRKPAAAVPTRNNGKGSSTGARTQAFELSGCSSILSMPLPNSGIFSAVPLDTLSTAIANIAHLVDALSGILNVPLPHPIFPFEGSECMISAQSDLWARAQVRSCCYSLSPATFMTDRTCTRTFDWTTLDELYRSGIQTHEDLHNPLLTMKSSSAAVSSGGSVGNVGSALNYELPIFLRPSSGEGPVREYSLNPNFTTAVALLQADIVTLCVSVGLPAEELWPPEAMLFNLHLLNKHCESAVQRKSANLLSQHMTGVPRVEEDRPTVFRIAAEDRSSAGSFLAGGTVQGDALDRIVLKGIRDRYNSQSSLDATRKSAAKQAALNNSKSYNEILRCEEEEEGGGGGDEGDWNIINANHHNLS